MPFTIGSFDENNALDQRYAQDYPLRVMDFFRNQGVGSWEINLAAFLADLNTNKWGSANIENIANNPYYYRMNYPIVNIGSAFEDALASV